MNELLSIPETDEVNRAISIARLKFGGDDGVFNTAGYSCALRDVTGRAWPSTTEIDTLLRHPRVSRLKGGCHWQYQAQAKAVPRRPGR